MVGKALPWPSPLEAAFHLLLFSTSIVGLPLGAVLVDRPSSQSPESSEGDGWVWHYVLTSKLSIVTLLTCSILCGPILELGLKDRNPCLN